MIFRFTILLTACLASSLLHGLAWGQSPENVRIHMEDGAGYAPCEPSIAIDPTNPNRIIAGSILDNVYTSLDGGHHWEHETLKSPHGVYGDPCIVAGPQGDFYYLHLSNPDGKGWASDKLLDRIVCQHKSEVDGNWSRGGSIGLNGSADQDKEWAAVHPTGERIAACWTEFDLYGSTDAKDRSRILCSTSGRSARRWAPPVTVSDVTGDCLDGDHTAEGAVPVWTKDGALAVVWARGDGLWFDRSADGGEIWTDEDILVAPLQGGWDQDIPGIGRCNGMPVTMVDHSTGEHEGRIYVNWTDTAPGAGKDHDVWICWSDDGGASWSKPHRVNDDATKADQFFTWMAVDPVTGFIHIVFYDRRSAEESNAWATEVYVATSTDGGNTWQNTCVSESPFTPGKAKFFGDYNNISAYAGTVRPIWTREDDGRLSIWTALLDFRP